MDYNPKCRSAPLGPAGARVLEGGEPVELTNLTPGGLLRFMLPVVSYQFETYFGSTCKEHFSELVSVVIESDGPRLILVWQTSLKCGNDADYLDRTVIQHKEPSR